MSFPLRERSDARRGFLFGCRLILERWRVLQSFSEFFQLWSSELLLSAALAVQSGSGKGGFSVEAAGATPGGGIHAMEASSGLKTTKMG